MATASNVQDSARQHPPAAAPRSSHRERIHKTTSQYVRQLREGCGDDRCASAYCHTGRCNTSPRPIRRYTETSARLIAVNVCMGSDPFAHLCKYLDSTTDRREETAQEDHENAAVLTRTDPSSFVQALASTAALRALSHEHVLLPPDIKSRAETETKTVEMVHDRLSSIPGLDVRTPGQACLETQTLVKCFQRCILYELHHRPDLPLHGSLIQRILVYTGARFELETNVNLRRKSQGMSTLKSKDVFSLLVASLEEHQQWKPNEHPVKLFKWCGDIFKREWHGRPTVMSGEVRGAALMLMDALHAECEGVEDAVKDSPIIDDGYFTNANASTEMALSWISHTTHHVCDPRMRHILHFPWLFPKNWRLDNFRAINYLRMRRAAAKSLSANRLRSEVMVDMNSPDPLPSRIENAEAYYLLLSVSRDNILRDTFDQLWQRKREELLRPLRVRLGEISELDFGQDLGGVQVEFFNLLFREAFAPAAQMFTLNSKSGMFWPQSGSLQPLYMFEMLGVLIGLALYNGITVPVSLPHIFYLFLGRPELARYPGLDWIEDGWPEIHDSLAKFTDADIESMEHAFPLEANGLRLSARLYTGNSKYRDCLAISEITRIGGGGGPGWRKKSDIVDSTPSAERVAAVGPLTVASLGIADAWPGWHLIDEPSDPTPVKDKHDYIRDFVRWLTLVSVRPQLGAMLKGVHHIFPPAHRQLAIIGFPEDLQTVTEGMQTLNVSALQEAATYVHYEVNDEYIAWFWEIVHAWPASRQWQLVKFVTAFERVPPGGEASVHFVIEKLGTEDGSFSGLPSSSTCFGTLYLPRYKTREVLAQKLEIAMEFGSEGFGVS